MPTSYELHTPTSREAVQQPVTIETHTQHPSTSEPWENATDLVMLKSMIENCTKCPLHETRTKFVFGVGNPNAKVMVIGEAPGADEDKKGEPFVGRAGQLLDKMLLAINFPREEVFIANILKSRPPGNRDPQPAEVAACEPYLWKQIDIIKPKMILCMGRIAGINLLKNGIDTLAKLRGNVYDFRGAKVMVTYHPAALLRNPNWKHGAWEDLQKFRALYDEMMLSVTE
ncbi:MAG: uracil-DNA glycosylase [Bacteroidetes bacterium]|nr:uracil-DNA glycosylase [Bacteroidota bacterium]